MARPKGSRSVDSGVFVRMTAEERALLARAVGRQLEGVTGATPSVPKFMLAASLAAAKKVLGEK
jgi:uncharacterized protein (DUF1778 family)